jgi:hypothetical protein
VQNSNPSHNPSPLPSSQSLDEALARAYERAVRRIRKGNHGTGSLFAVLTGESPDESARPRSTAAPHVAAKPHERDARVDRDEPPTSGTPVTLDELLPVFREPIEWALARAERHAESDPVDLAALDRVRAAYQSLLAWIASSGLLGEARPNLRPTDVLTVAGLLIGSIESGFAQRASVGMREGLLDVLADLILPDLGDAPGSQAVSYPSGPFGCGDAIPHAVTPFGPPPLPRPTVPWCCCRYGHVL